MLKTTSKTNSHPFKKRRNSINSDKLTTTKTDRKTGENRLENVKTDQKTDQKKLILDLILDNPSISRLELPRRMQYFVDLFVIKY